MAKRIIDLVSEMAAKIAQSQNDAAALAEAEANAERAVKAIMKGRGSVEYRDYMLRFVDRDEAGNPTVPIGETQLARLLADDEPIEDALIPTNRRRAYLLGNGICGGGSPGFGANFNFARTVETLDTGIDLGEEDATGQESAVISDAASQ